MYFSSYQQKRDFSLGAKQFFTFSQNIPIFSHKHLIMTGMTILMDSEYTSHFLSSIYRVISENKMFHLFNANFLILNKLTYYNL